MVDIPWPNIRTEKNEKGFQKVPLQENYSMEDMWYLDTNEASLIFSYQAELVKNWQSKGIVDVGCRHGPILNFLNSYSHFHYMGFDTSVEPIQIAQSTWKNYKNIEFRCASWHNKKTFKVNFTVDTVIFSGVLLYVENHFEFFKKIINFYQAKYAIIQEPWHKQKHWDQNLILNTITNDLDKYFSNFNITGKLIDCEIFAGRRLILAVTL